MAKAQEVKNEEVLEETVEKPKRGRGKASKPEKEIEIADEIVDDEEETETVEEVKPVEVKKNARELRKELRSKKNEIEVELLNINSGGTSCRDRNGRLLFDFDSYGEREFLTLADVYEVATKYKNYFSKHQIVIVDIDTDDYSIEEIIEFLGLNELYDEIENFDTDYISLILKLKNEQFEKMMENANEDLVKSVANRAVELFRNGKFDSRRKEFLLAEKLGVEFLFEA